MLQLTTHHYLFFRKKEIWFYEGEPVSLSAYTSFCYADHVPKKFNQKLEEQTSTIDLTLSETTLHSSINTTFKYHIRKALKMDFNHEVFLNPSMDQCKSLIDAFNSFAVKKKITPANRNRIYALQKISKVIITRIKQENNEVVCHVYLHDNKRILLLHTFHPKTYQNDRFRGYANKLLHWQDITTFKNLGFTTYDFGGIDLQKVPGISRFKLSYGGSIRNANSYTYIGPLLTPFFTLYKRLRK